MMKDWEKSKTMNNSLPNQQRDQQPASQPQKTGSLKTFVLLKVGVIEALFVGITLILLFGILNYFNILPISKIFPNQLGFLPHKQSQQSQQLSNVAMKQSLPSPNYSSTVFQYDIVKAKKEFIVYI